MKTKELFLTIFLVLAVLVSGCGKVTVDIEPIARTASNEVGVVGKTSKGTKGAGIVFLEERHTSRAGQIELAIVLLRLHDLNGLKHIELEGYLKEDPKIEIDWFKKAAKDDLMTRARVAASLLKEGEISAAEFMKLVYDDIVLDPIELKAEHSVEISQDEGRAPRLYLLKIAQKSVRQEHVPRLQQFEDEIAKLSGEAKQTKSKEMLEYILSIDPWATEKSKVLRDANVGGSMSAENFIKTANEIKERAQNLAVPISPAEKTAMEGYIEFFDGRIKASKTMMVTAGEIADRRDVSLVALNIGAAHTAGMTDMAVADNRPFAVITPLSLNKNEKKGDLTIDMFNRKQKKLSVYSEGFTDTIFKTFPDSKQNLKKPPTILSEPPFQGKSELSLFTHRIARAMLMPQSPPGGGKPPYGFSDDDFNGKWIYIDPKRISVIQDGRDIKKRAVLFRAIINHENPEMRREIWVKAGLVMDKDGKIADDPNIESLLKKLLSEVKTEDVPDKKAEDEAGRIHITLDTIAAFGTSEEAVKNVSLTEM